jgi:hypothetical protein
MFLSPGSLVTHRIKTGITKDAMEVEPSKTIMSKNGLKAKTPEEPEGCTVLVRDTRKACQAFVW